MEETIKSILIDLVKRQIISAIVSKIPFFSGGIPQVILAYFVGKLAVLLVEETIIGAKVLSSRYAVNRQVRELEDGIRMSERDNLTDEQKEQILKRIRDASDSLIKF